MLNSAFSQTGILLPAATKNFAAYSDSINAVFKGKKVKGAYKRWKRLEYFYSLHLDENGNMINYAGANNEALNEMRIAGMGATGNWQFVGPFDTDEDFAFTNSEGIGRVNCMAFIDADTWLVGTAGGGLWKTDVGGIYLPDVPGFDNPWTPLTDNNAVLSISGIAVKPAAPNTIYILTGDGDWGATQPRVAEGVTPSVPSVGILKSTDGGITWNTTSLVFGRDEIVTATKLIMHPANANKMYATTSKGIYYTTDGWNTNTLIFSTDFVRDIEFNPSNSNIFYFSTNDKVYKSVDGTITDITAGLTAVGLDADCKRINIAVSPAAPNSLYVISVNSGRGLDGVYISYNKGASFVRVLNGFDLNILAHDGSEDILEDGQGEYDLAFSVDPANANKIMVGGIGMWASYTGGITWAHLCGEDDLPDTYVHADIHTIDFNPFDGTIVCGSDGGLYASPNGSNDEYWEKRCQGLAITQFYHMDVNTASSYFALEIIGGAQDNGVSSNSVGAIISAGEEFDPLNFDHQQQGGDGFNVFSGKSEFFEYRFTDIQNGKIYMHFHDPLLGWTYSNITPDAETDPETDDGLGSWDTPLDVNPSEFKSLIAGYDDLYYTNNYGDDWTVIYDNDQPGFIKETAWSKTNGNNIAFYFNAETGNNKIISTNLFYLGIFGGDYDWTIYNLDDITGNGDSPVSDIQISDDTYPNNLIVTIPGYDAPNKIFRLQPDSTWKNLTYNLPNVPALCAAIDEFGIYIGTDIGVFHLNTNDTVWIYYSENLPTVPVTQIEIVEDIIGKRIYCSTYGRGIWKADPAPPDRITRYYVNKTAVGLNDGSSWANAFTKVQSAIDAALPGDTIWVASGTYYPTTSYFITGGSAARLYAFAIDNNTVMLGGFNGTETNVNQRDVALNPTILSGDLGIIGTATDNAYHVLRFINSTKNSMIDGFTIRDGRADGAFVSDHALQTGAGIRLLYDSTMAGRPVFKNCIFSNNYAGNGAAVYIGQYFNRSMQTTFINCAFNNNTTFSSGYGSRGAGLYVDTTPSSGSPHGEIGIVLDSCSFSNNAAGEGAGIYNDASYNGVINYKINNTVFAHNKNTPSLGTGGGIYNYSGNFGKIDLTLSHCNLTDNDATAGGGIYNNGQQGGEIDIAVSYCNVDSSSGYGIYATVGLIDMQIDHCTFTNGGGVYHQGSGTDLSSTGKISNCSFTNNSTGINLDASQSGTGFANKYLNYVIDSCSFTGCTSNGINCSNYSQGTGSYHVTYSVSNSTFTNNIGSKGGGIYNHDGYITCTINNCDFTGNYASGYDGGAIYTVVYGLGELSIDGCNFTNNHSASLGGAIYTSHVVNTNILNSAFSGNFCGSGGAIYTTNGYYNKNYYYNFKNCTFDNNTASVKGGAYYDASNDVAEVKMTIDSCLFNGNISTQEGAGIYFTNTGDIDLTLTNTDFVDNSTSLRGGGFYIITSSSADTMNVSVDNCNFDNNYAFGRGGGIFAKSGFTNQRLQMSITDCDFTSNESDYTGGAIAINEGGGGNGPMDISIWNCLISGNDGALAAGGVYAYQESSSDMFNLDIQHCLFENNISAGNSGGLYIGANGKIIGAAQNCQFINNTATSFGGGARLYAYAGDLNDFDFKNCLFENNTSSDVGGGIFIHTDVSGTINSAIDNCLFTNNEADRGGAFYISASNSGSHISVPITGNTIANNNATIETGGIYVTRTSTAAVDVDIVNSILWNNTDVAVTLNKKQAYVSGGATGSINNSIISELPAGYTDGGSNLFTDPLFINAADYDGADNSFATDDDGFSIQPASPALNAGAMVAASLDIKGLVRPQDDFFDIGAYELPGCTDPDLPVITGDNIICSGDTTILSVSSGNLNSATNWQWYTGGCGTGLTGTGNSISLIGAGASITVYVRGEGGCITPGTCATYNITVNPVPGNVTGLKANLVTSCSIKYKWNAVATATSYVIEYKPSASPTWLSAGSTATTNKTITGLVANTPYDVRVRAINASGCAGNWAQKNNTLTYAFDLPNNPSEMSIASTSVTLKWTAPSCGSTPLSYQLQYKKSTDPTWTTISGITTLNYNLTGLLPSTAYNWKVRAVYAGGNSAFTKVRSFNTLPMKDGTNTEQLITISPNPNDGNFEFSFTMEDINEIEVSVKNTVGQIVYFDELKSETHFFHQAVSLYHLPAGIYYMQIVYKDGSAVAPVTIQ